MKISKTFKLKNPFFIDEYIKQDVVLSDEPQFDYSESKWLAIDTEFINLDIAYTQLATIQIASEDPEDDRRQRVEVIWVTELLKDPEKKLKLQEFLKTILDDESKELLMHVSTADLTRVEQVAEYNSKNKIFDTKVAGRIALTNIPRHSMVSLITNLIDPNFQKDSGITSSQWDQNPEMWTDKMFEYAMNDVIYLRPLQNRILNLAKQRGVENLVEEAMEILPHLSKLYLNGFDEKILSY